MKENIIPFPAEASGMHATSEINSDEYRELTLDALAARLEYQERREQPTQNAHGVRVGDLFYESWGYEQTNVDFYEVVELKGKATAILREIGKEYIGGYGWTGKVRPCRGQYCGEPFQVRTSLCTWSKDEQVQCGSPRGNGSKLNKTEDDAEHNYSTYA